MLTLEQVRTLEQRVRRAIDRITELQAENVELRDRLATYQRRIDELEQRVEGYASGQEEIERSVLQALQTLEAVEDAVADLPGESRLVQLVEDGSDAGSPDAGDPAPPAAAQDDHDREHAAPPVEAYVAADDATDEEAEAEPAADASPELDIF